MVVKDLYKYVARNMEMSKFIVVEIDELRLNEYN